MLLNEQQTHIRDMAREFARKEITPFAAEWDRAGAAPGSVIAKMGALGMMGVCVPEEWGGAGADFVSYVSAIEAIAYGDAGLANVVAGTNSPVCAGLLNFANDDQKERFLRPLASGKGTGAFLLSEPQAGSDASNLLVRAEKVDGGYAITGMKNFVTGGATAAYAMILAVTGRYADKAMISCFITRTDAEGYIVARHEQKLGHRTCDTCQIVLDGLFVPESDMIAGVGEGLKIALSSLSGGRIGVAAQSVGVAQAALDAALNYASERIAFGKPIIEHQAVAFQLAEMATKIEVARQMYLHAALLKDLGQNCTKEASIAKLFASEMVEIVTSAAIQIHGGYGFLNDYPVEKYYRDMRVFQIYDGTNEVQKMLIARELRRNQ